MNKNIFLVDLSKCLGFMTETDREEALRYYTELFDEAGPENEQKVLAQLGSPTKVAVELHRSYDRSHADTTGVERLLRGDFSADGAAESEEEAETEEFSVTESLPAIEDILKNVSAMDEPAAEETPAEAPAEAEAPAAEPEDEPAEEALPVVEESAEEPSTEEAAAEEAAAEEAAPAADKSEPVFVDVPVPASVPVKAEEKPEPEAEPMEKKRGMPGWAIALVLVFTCWLWIPIFAALFSIAVSIAVIPLSIAAAFFAIAGYLGICAIWALGVISDALLMFGAAAIALALGLVLLWLAIWALVKLIGLLLRGTAASYRGIFGLPRKERAK